MREVQDTEEIPGEKQPVVVFGVEYLHIALPDGDDLYVTDYGIPFLGNILPDCVFTDREWFDSHSTSLRSLGPRAAATSCAYKVRTKRWRGKGIDVVLKWNRMGQDIPGSHDNEELWRAAFNSPYEEFARITRDSDSFLYPMVHPYPERDRYDRIMMSPAAYRGLAKNFYAQGVDGVGAFNYMYHWSGYNGWGYVGAIENYPAAFAYLRELRDPADLQAKDRHYISYPIFGHFGARDQRRKIVLVRGEPGVFKRYVLRAAEDWSGPEKAILRFVAVGLVPQDEITVKFNGKVVPEGELKRTHHPDGRTDVNEGAKLAAHTICEFVPATPPVEPVKQILEVALVQGVPDAAGQPIVIPEIEVAVAASGGDPAEVMRRTRFQPKPPMKLLAGHRPEHILLWAEVKAAGQMAGRVGKGAIPFTLKKKSRVTAVDIAMQPSDIGACPREGDVGGITATLQRDLGGKPEGQPVADGATVNFFPWKNRHGLTIKLQGYYKFEFPKPLVLEAGRYWLTLKRMPGGGRYRYYVWGHVGDENHVGEWFQDGGAMNYWTFFGVHGEYLDD